MCVIDFFIKHNFESQTQTQVCYFTWVVWWSFLLLRLFWRGSAALTSELGTAPTSVTLQTPFSAWWRLHTDFHRIFSENHAVKFWAEPSPLLANPAYCRAGDVKRRGYLTSETKELTVAPHTCCPAWYMKDTGETVAEVKNQSHHLINCKVSN